jgi:hypothetical protein
MEEVLLPEKLTDQQILLPFTELKFLGRFYNNVSPEQL